MNELTLKELQSFSLDILKDIHNFCEANDIRYVVAFGTLIGAVRHNGFIPWDDDVDVMMPRPDYEKFRSLYKSERYRLIDSKTAPDAYISFGRVCDSEKTLVKSLCPWHGPSCRTGVWVDVFPMDAIPRDKKVYHELYHHMHFLLRSGDRARGRSATYRDAFNLSSLLKIWFKRTFHPNRNGIIPEHFVMYMQNEMKHYTYSEDCLLGHMSHPWAEVEEEGIEAADLNDRMKVRFEDTEVYVPKAYDKILRAQYGDYTQLPPVEERRPPQHSYLRIFWK